MSTKKYKQKGQALIFIALGIVGLIGMVGLAIDGGNAFSDRRKAQNAADNSAINAALVYSKNYDTIDNGAAALTLANTAAKNLATTNGYIIIDDNIVPTNAPIICATGGKDFTVSITSDVDTMFASVVGIPTVTNHVTAIARACKPAGNPGGGPLFENVGALSTLVQCYNTGFAGISLGTNGIALVNLFGGANMQSVSTDPSCINLHNGDVNLYGADEFATTGCGDILVSGLTVSNSNAVSSPCAGEMIQYNQPAPIVNDIDMSGRCDPAIRNDGTPGTYNGTFPPSGITTLQPGLYCLNDDFLMNGVDDLTATGVTIYVKNGDIDIRGSTFTTLVAAVPSTNPSYNDVNNQIAIAYGAIPGLLVYSPKTSDHNVQLNGDGNMYLQGTWLTAGDDCLINGTWGNIRQKVQFICKQVRVNGTAEINIEYDPLVLYYGDNVFAISLIQ